MTVRLPVIYLSEEVKRPLLLHYFIYHKTIGALLQRKRASFTLHSVNYWLSDGYKVENDLFSCNN